MEQLDEQSSEYKSLKRSMRCMSLFRVRHWQRLFEISSNIMKYNKQQHLKIYLAMRITLRFHIQYHDT